MDDVACRGEETSIWDCKHSKDHDCGKTEAAGVICTDKTDSPSIAAPTTVVVASEGPSKDVVGQCFGQYNLVPEKTVNGHPLWKHENDKWFIFFLFGVWNVGTSTSGDGEILIKCRPGPSEGPFDQSLTWVYQDSDTGKWKEDAGLTCSVYDNDLPPPKPTPPPPVSLKVESTGPSDSCYGRYNIIPGKIVGGYHIWKHETNQCFIVFRNGVWNIGTGNDESVRIKAKPDLPKQPYDPSLVWLHLDSDTGKWNEDPDLICSIYQDVAPPITTTQTPVALSVSSVGPSKSLANICFGKFILIPNKIVSNKPVWKHENYKCKIFFRFGVWNIGPDSTGIIKSKPSPTKEPYDPSISWLFVDNRKWKEDPDLICSIWSEGSQTKSLPIWTTVFYSAEERQLTKGNLVTEIPSLGKEWRVSHDFKPTSYGTKGWASSLHLTVGGDAGTHGDRTPAIFFRHKSMYVAVSKDTYYNHIYNTVDNDRPLLNEWTTIIVSQEQTNDGIYMIKLVVGCREIISFENKKPRFFSDVKVYASNPFTDAQPGIIRDIAIETTGSLKGQGNRA